MGWGMPPPKEWGFFIQTLSYDKGFFPLWLKEEDGGKNFLDSASQTDEKVGLIPS